MCRNQRLHNTDLNQRDKYDIVYGSRKRPYKCKFNELIGHFRAINPSIIYAGRKHKAPT